MVTAAAVAHVDRLPVLLLPGDVFASRRPDPVLQQVESFADGTVSANDCFRPVSRYFDRITRPEQFLDRTAARAVGADRSGGMRAGDAGAVPGRAGRGVRLSGNLLRAAHLAHRAARGRTTPSWPRRPHVLRAAKAPLIIAGGGVHYADATDSARSFRDGARHSGRGDAGRQECAAARSSRATSARSASPAPRRRTRRQRRPTSSWRSARGCRTSPPAPGRLFRNPARNSSALNVQPFDAGKRHMLPLVADAREGLAALDTALADYRAPRIVAAPLARGDGTTGGSTPQPPPRRPTPHRHRTRR